MSIKENIFELLHALLLLSVSLCCYSTYQGLSSKRCDFCLCSHLRILYMDLMDNQGLQSDFCSLDPPHTFRIQHYTECIIKDV